MQELQTTYTIHDIDRAMDRARVIRSQAFGAMLKSLFAPKRAAETADVRGNVALQR